MDDNVNGVSRESLYPKYPVLPGDILEIKIDEIFDGKGVGYTKQGMSVFIKGEKKYIVIGKIVKVHITRIIPAIQGFLIPDDIWRSKARK